MAIPLLSKVRLDNDSDGPDVVIGHNELEEALGLILGIPDGQNISETVFGTVASDGSFTIIRFSSDGPKAAGQAAGFLFTDGSVVKKLCFVNSKIEIWERTSTNPDVWELMFDYETVTAPNFHELTDVLTSSYVAEKIFQVENTDNPSGLVMGDENADSEGYTKIIQLDDVSSDFDGKWGVLSEKWLFEDHALGVNADGTLLVPVDISNTASYGAWLKRAAMSMTQVGILGNGTWTTVGPWTVDAGSSTTSLAALNGVSGAGIVLPAGIYRIKPSWTLRAGSGLGMIAWRLAGSGFQDFPRPSPYLHMTALDRSFTSTLDTNLSSTVNLQSSMTRSQDCGAVMVVAGSQFTVGLQMGCSVAGHSIQPEMAIERII